MVNKVIIPTASQPLNNVQWFGVGKLTDLVLQQLEVVAG